jgi:pimeloyl-ACP methyl ester carboxylesterase
VTGTPALLFLPGALDRLEGSDAAARRLGESRRLIHIRYRPDDTFDALLTRILAVADESGAGPLDLLGQSYGGWIGQCLARLHPLRVRRLVLSHSFVLTPGQAWRLRLGSRILRGLPLPVMRPLLLARVRRALAPLARTDPERVEQQIAQVALELQNPDFRAKLGAQQGCMAESLKRPLPAMRSDMPILILESDDDPLVPRRARQALRQTYPGPQVHRFPAAGHISALAETSIYAETVQAFLDR